MKQFKGTPGPWSIGYYADGGGIFIAGTYGGPDPTYICSVRPDLRSSQSDANADLIAAAPELLEALQRIMKEAENPKGELYDLLLAIGEAKPAINKALGGE